MAQARSVVESLEQRRAAVLGRLADVERASRLRPRSAEAGLPRGPRPSALMAAVSSDWNERASDAFTHQTRNELESLSSALTEATSVLSTLHAQRRSLLARHNHTSAHGDPPPLPPPVLADPSVDSASSLQSSSLVPTTSMAPKWDTKEQTRPTPAAVPSLPLAALVPSSSFADTPSDDSVPSAPKGIASSDEQAHSTRPPPPPSGVLGRLSQAMLLSSGRTTATPLVAAKEASMARVREKKAALLVRKVNQPKKEVNAGSLRLGGGFSYT